MKKWKKLMSAFLATAMAASVAVPTAAVSANEPTEPVPEDGRIYSIATAHLDTVWNWEFGVTVRDYLPAVFNQNFAYIEENPDYNFNFEGAYRYDVIKEYYPEVYEQIGEYIAEGRWNTAGSSWENGDVNGPSPEGLFRNILYGNQFFADEFGNDKRSKDIYLPDCFGFGKALPSIMVHSNLLGFSTQKLYTASWGCSVDKPYDVGRWTGPDGKTALASVVNTDYNYQTPSNIRSAMASRLATNKNNGWNGVTYYHGIGDCGGGPTASSVRNLMSAISQNDENAVKVISSSTDQWARDITAEEKAALPNYDGEFLMSEHGTGSYTARTTGHRWNSRNELLGTNAEAAAVAASWLGTQEYPMDALTTAWKRVITHQFHDDITGTSVAAVYLRSWNDYMLSLNQFGNEYENAIGGVASVMDTSKAEGVALVVNNPVAADRQDVVTASVTMPEECEFIRVYDDQGKEVASQILSREGNTLEIAFEADVESMGYRVYDVRKADAASEVASALKVTENTLENGKYTVTIDDNGDISSIYDKELEKELLADPIRMGMFNDTPATWQAWELTLSNYWNKDPHTYVADTASKMEIVENGPARVAIKVTRQFQNSTYEQVISLENGGQTVDVQNWIDWDERSTFLKSEFNLSCGNSNATYDLGLGAVERPNNTSRLAEVPAQKWADITAEDGSYGVSILSDSRNGWDKPYDDTLRLTLIHTPHKDHPWDGDHGMNLLDVGENVFGYSIYGHEGVVDGSTQKEAQFFTQPMTAYQTVQHEGNLGSNYSFASVSNDDIIIRAIKAGEVGEGLENKGDEIIVRFNEGANKAASDVEFTIGDGIESVRPVFASEESLTEEALAETSAYRLEDGKLIFDMTPYEVRTFALKLKDPTVKGEKADSASVTLPYDTDAISSNANKDDADLTVNQDAFPSELLPGTITAAGVDFVLGSEEDGQNNALKAKGQTINLPEGNYNTLYLLAFSINNDREATFQVGDSTQTISIADYAENVGEWNYVTNMIPERNGYIKEDDVAFVSTHRHYRDTDKIAADTYMFKYALDIPEGATTVTLPDDEDVVIMAATVADESAPGKVVTELYDSRERNDDRGEISAYKGGATGFESTDPTPVSNKNQWSSNVENVSLGAASYGGHDSSGVYKMSGKIRQGSGAANDTTAPVLEGYIYYNTEIPVEEDTYVSYWMKTDSGCNNHVNLDLNFADGLPLSERPDAVDQNGISMSPAATRPGKDGEWVFVTCDIGKFAAGNTITDVLFSYQDHDRTTSDPLYFTAYIDDLFIGSASYMKDLLKEKIEEASAIEGGLYTPETFEALQKAIENAQAVVEDPDASIDDINTASTALENAVKALVSNGKAELAAALVEAKAIDGAGYTEESFAVLTAAIKDGQTVYDNPESTKEQRDNATKAIKDAIADLESNATRAPFETIEAESYNANFSEGTINVQTDPNASRGKYISCSYYGNATAAFRRIDFTGTNGASGITVGYQQSYGTGSLEIRTGSPTGPLVATLSLPSTGWYEYGEETFDLDSVIPPQLTNVYVVLKSSSLYLDYIQFVEAEDPNGPPTDKNIQDLKDALAEAATKDAKYFTEESYAALAEAVKAAEAVQADPDATCGEYNIVIADLREALSGLVDNGVKGLTEAIEKAKGYSNDDNKYTEESYAALTKAVEDAEAILAKEDATKEERDNAASAVNDAINGLQERRDAYTRIEAETYDEDHDIVNDGTNIGGVQPGDWVGYHAVDFGKLGAESFTMYYSAENGGDGNRTVDIWIDGHDEASGGTKIGSLTVRQTGGWSRYQEASGNLDVIPTGVHTVYLTFSGNYSYVVNVDWFQFTEAEPSIPSEEDLQALKDAIAEAEAYDANNYTEDSYAALTSAVEAGKALLDNAEATKTQVLDATQAIKDAIDALTAKEFVLSASADKDTYEPNETITLTIKTSAD
ncbi:carbohydrate-binding protein, partial [[Clostridium] leptum]|nr:carbohydrate-binding protein [[Clostridium] leptum]